MSSCLWPDHKPLQLILNNSYSKPPARIECWGLRLQLYHFTVIHWPGKNIPADYISRHPDKSVPFVSNRQSKVAEDYVNFLSGHAVPKALTITEIKAATSTDSASQLTITATKTDRWKQALHKAKATDRATVESLYRVRSELTVNEDNNLLLRGTRLVIPSALQDRVLNIAHEGHRGVVRTKQLIREKVWFPGVDAQVERLVTNCLPCQAGTPKQTSAPLQMSELPSRPWAEISVDFSGPYPSGEYLLVAIDEYSRFPVVEVVHSTSASTVIPQLDKMFALFGIPDQVKSDNGPPFSGHEFTTFAGTLGFKHRKITPLWPKANAEAERFMRTLGKVMKAAQTSNKTTKEGTMFFPEKLQSNSTCYNRRKPC